MGLIKMLCSQGLSDRTCGGYKDFSVAIKLYYNSTAYKTVEDWYESFPHIYFSFYPDAVISLYPRDYIYYESDGVYRLGFDVLDSRIILGGIFMRNYDILFNRIDRTVTIVRSECSPSEAGFDFKQYYFHHPDDEHYKNIKEEAAKKHKEEGDGLGIDLESNPLVRVLVIVVALIIFSLGMFYFLVVRRFDRYGGQGQMIGGSEYSGSRIEHVDSQAELQPPGGSAVDPDMTETS